MSHSLRSFTCKVVSLEAESPRLAADSGADYSLDSRGIPLICPCLKRVLVGSHFQVVHVVAAFVNCVVERACFSVMSVLLFHYFIAEIQILLSNMLANSPPPPTRRVGSIKCCCILIHEQSALQINCLVVTSAELKPVITEQLLYVNCISITFSGFVT